MRAPSREGESLEITSLSALEHIAAHRPERLVRLSIARGARAAKLAELAAKNGITIDFGGGPAEGSGAKGWVKKFEYADLNELLPALRQNKRSVILGLDHIQDPQNFGALCRSAEAFGVSAIVIPKDRSVSVTPAVYQASVGAVETIPVTRVANLKDASRKLKEEGFWSVATMAGAGTTELSEMPDFEKIFFVLGAEGDGVNHALAKECDLAVSIPMLGRIESLNVSVSTAILLYEFVRRSKK